MTPKLSRLLVLFMMLAVTCLTNDARAHSFPEEQHPSAGQTLSTPPAEIRIKFDAPIEKLFAKLQVLDAAGKDHAAGPPQVSSDGIELSSKLEELATGQYTVRWSALCVDTHHTEGSYSFTVGGGGS
jgi:methionine-rich copper-binding protein CopC